MPHSYETIRQLALALPYDERAKLSEELWWSLDPPAEDLPQAGIDAAWDAEIKRRVEEIKSGTAQTIPLEQAISEMDARIAACRNGEGPRNRSRK
jgi:putative addiction module component (TIGR02574 family)